MDTEKKKTPDGLAKLMKHTDLLGAAAVVLIVCMLIIPIPPFILDLFITLNIALALAILVSTLYMKKALDLSSFPSLLLLTTMFRLAINVSVTRLILLEGDAGHVITAFGDFVVGGNVVVGLIIFLVLIVIQFVVVTNGAGRVAEVGARFTLDAMPGKQMAIDADLNSGQITEEEARLRARRDLPRGAVLRRDGQRLEVLKGDAIAALLTARAEGRHAAVRRDDARPRRRDRRLPRTVGGWPSPSRPSRHRRGPHAVRRSQCSC
ncbi:MAG TPA: FHIPEP family type III secretion protein [Solirubrobacteraceae bacterium]|nr:FHIPEP family type III secretion protein [Solirubrobacteraceae bacterium]